jgi:hypothetical protein
MQKRLYAMIDELSLITDPASSKIQEIVNEIYSITKILDSRLDKRQLLENELKRGAKYEEYSAKYGSLPAVEMMKIHVSVYFQN